MPPRHGKSEICSRYLPGYIFGRWPDAQILAASYGAELIEGMSIDVKRIINSEEYAKVFPWVMLPGKRARTDRSTKATIAAWGIQNHRGQYRCAGIGGGFTGRGGGIGGKAFGIIDDPVKDRAEAESKGQREKQVEWYKSVFRTRFREPRILLLMTRWQMDDLAGWCMKKAKNDPKADRWKVVSFPAVFEEQEYTHPEDPRGEGEALWPEFQNEEQLANARANLDGYTWAGLFQQQPLPSGGAVVKREWLNVIEPGEVPAGLQWVRYWDLAVTKKSKADYTASGLMAVDDELNVYVKGYVRMQEKWPTVRRHLIHITKREGVPVGIESQGVQKGFFDDLITTPELMGCSLQAYTVEKDKFTRALPWVARAENGKMFLVREPGVDECMDELVEFTGSGDTHDDQVDWISGAYKMLQEYVAPIWMELGTYGE